ncbi:type II toxin-antitoxin system RelE/ParE family toxin [bacterium]|nr:type II toxin-antitoxin system RelE/ParE family toxin [bacterium]
MRIFFAFDPNREAILLIGDNKRGDKGFYQRMVPVADTLYGQHLDKIRRKNDKK